ncbi:MAG: SCO family protein [Verrucomicrobiia bacterium]
MDDKPSRLPRLFWSGLMLILIAMFGVMIWRTTKRSPALPTYGQVSAFSLTNQINQTITRDSLLGKVWIADFIFTTCPGPCLVMSRQMKKLQTMLHSDDNIYLISITVDPETDTPPVLTEYAKQMEANTNHWFFLTGDQKKIFHLATKGFLLAVAETQQAEAASKNGRYIHSIKFALVDQKGYVRGYYDGTDDEELPKLIHQARSLNIK